MKIQDHALRKADRMPAPKKARGSTKRTVVMCCLRLRKSQFCSYTKAQSCQAWDSFCNTIIVAHEHFHEHVCCAQTWPPRCARRSGGISNTGFGSRENRSIRELGRATPHRNAASCPAPPCPRTISRPAPRAAAAAAAPQPVTMAAVEPGTPGARGHGDAERPRKNQQEA